MLKGSLRQHVRSMLGLVTLAMSATLACAQSGAIQITSVSPTTINPSSYQYARVTYTTPTTGNYQLYVQNSAGTNIRNINSFSGMRAGTYYASWNGRDRNNAIVPNGTYNFVITGRTSSGAQLTAARAAITVGTGGTTTPPPTTGAYAFKITGTTPNPFNPGSGQTTTVTYTVPTTADYRMLVRNSAGTEIRGLVTYKGVTPKTMTRVWDGKDNAGKVVPNGTYTIVIGEAKVSGTTTAITMATGTVAVQSSTTTPPPATGAFAVTGISPSTFDAKAGQTATATYTVPTTANYSVAVRNSAGAAIRTLASFTSKAAGTYTQVWDGKDTAGAIVADGTYTIAVTGTNTSGATITAGTGTVTVKTATVTPPPPTSTGAELGQTIEGGGSANFSYFNTSSGTKFGAAFVAPKTGAIKQITMQWKSSSGYGNSTDGTYGIYTFELQSNGSGNYPSGTVITKVSGITQRQMSGGYSDGAVTINLSANLVAGQTYHLVCYNTHSNPSSNWSSPNTLMSGVYDWDGGKKNGPRAEIYISGSWKPWTSKSNMWGGGNNYVNGGHFPMMLTWTDGTTTGDPYYSASFSTGAYWYGSSKAGEYILWNNPTTTISKVGVLAGKKGSPAGALIYHLEKIGSGDLAKGTIATASQVGTNPTWVYATLPQAVTLTQGQAYRLWFESPSSSNSSNCYYQYPPYGENRPAQWLSSSWGGTQSYYTAGTSSWSDNRSNSDLTFSLQ